MTFAYRISHIVYREENKSQKKQGRIAYALIAYSVELGKRESECGNQIGI